MSSAWRIEYDGALYHLVSRGNGGQAIYLKLRGTVKHQRDLVMHLLWNQCVFTNERVGRFFNISGSAVSHSVKLFQNKL